jgi:hypothetical protein
LRGGRGDEEPSVSGRTLPIRHRRHFPLPFPRRLSSHLALPTIARMETRSSPSMAELRVIAAERGLKYYMHLSKPELFDLLQRKEGGGSTVHSTSPTPSATPATVSVVKEPTAAHTKESLVRPSERAHDETAADKSASSTNKRCSQRLSALKRKAPADDADSESPEKKRLKRVINSHDPIMLTELGPHTVRSGSMSHRRYTLMADFIVCWWHSLSLCDQTDQLSSTTWRRWFSIFSRPVTSRSRKRGFHFLTTTCSALIRR